MASCHLAMVERERAATPKTDQVTQGADPELEERPNCQVKSTLEPAWVAFHSAQRRGGPKTQVCGGEGTQRPSRRGATGCSRLLRQLLLRHGWTVARVGPFVIFVFLLVKRTVELMACPVCSEGTRWNVTKFHIPHSVQSSLIATTFSRDEKFKTSPLVSAHPS